MSIPSKQIGWSQESNLLWEILKQLGIMQSNIGGLQGAITLTTTGDSGPATLIGNILNIPEYTLAGLGGVPLTRTITINGDTQTLANDVAFTVLGQAISIVANYSALPAPATVPGAFYWAEASQGTYWLPGSLGGTFYNAGLYYSNGAVWQFMETPYQATQLEVDAGINFSKFVTPLTFDAAARWATKQNTLILTTNNTSGAATLVGSTLNIPIYSGATNLAYIAAATNGTITSSTGTSAIIPSFTTALAGLVPAPITVSGRLLSDNGTWVVPPSSGVPTTRTININGNALDLSANREWRVAQGDTGVLTFASPGLSVNSTTAINIGAVTGYVINNETNPAIPSYTFVNYPGGIAIPVTSRLTGLASYVLLQSGGTILFQNTLPTSAQRKANLWLGKVSHPVGGNVVLTINEPDYITSPESFARDIFQAIGPYVNDGIYPSANGANLSVNISSGNVFGNGINFVNDRTNPNRIAYATSPNATTPVAIGYRTFTGNGSAASTTMLPGNYDLAGAVTAIPGGPNVSTLQYLWYVPGQGFLFQYGQTLYNNFEAAVAAVGKEANNIFPNFINNAILISVLAVKKSATALNVPADALFFKADKLGQIGSAGGGSGVSAGPVTIVITQTAGVTTATTDANGYGQDGRNVVFDNGATAFSYTCNGGITATFARHNAGGVGNSGIITFAQGVGRTLISVDGPPIFNGFPGSTASLWSVGLIDYLRISNA